jgi:hypothetical protein
MSLRVKIHCHNELIGNQGNEVKGKVIPIQAMAALRVARG